MTPLPMEHLDRERCDEYVLGRGSEIERRAVESHVAFCQDCAKLLHATRSFIMALRNAAAGEKLLDGDGQPDTERRD